MATSKTWRFLRSGPGSPAFNMAMDEALLRADPVLPTLRTYGWEPPTLSLGYFQVVNEDRLRPFREKGYGIVRRPTGGRAIFHADELTYALVWPVGAPGLPRDTVRAYEVVHGALARAFARFGVSASLRGDRVLLSDSAAGTAEFLCFYRSSPFDLIANDRKLVGSAQRRTGRGFLMHGSIPTGPNPVAPLAAFGGMRPKELEPVFAEELATALGVRFEEIAPSPDEVARAGVLATRKYSSPAFTISRNRA